MVLHMTLEIPKHWQSDSVTCGTSRYPPIPLYWTASWVPLKGPWGIPGPLSIAWELYAPILQRKYHTFPLESSNLNLGCVIPVFYFLSLSSVWALRSLVLRCCRSLRKTFPKLNWPKGMRQTCTPSRNANPEFLGRWKSWSTSLNWGPPKKDEPFSKKEATVFYKFLFIPVSRTCDLRNNPDFVLTEPFSLLRLRTASYTRHPEELHCLPKAPEPGLTLETLSSITMALPHSQTPPAPTSADLNPDGPPQVGAGCPLPLHSCICMLQLAFLSQRC